MWCTQSGRYTVIAGEIEQFLCDISTRCAIKEGRELMSEDHRVDTVLSRMTLDEKVGQCITNAWKGSMITPSIIDAIEKLHTGGLRIEAFDVESAKRLYYGYNANGEDFEKPEGYFNISESYFKYKTPGFSISATEYATRLNKLKEIAMNRPSGVPLHICTDFEGDFSHDFPYDNINLFPANMGIRAAGEPKLAYEVGYALGSQLSAVGITMLHSPVCDVNINPENPEIQIRAFSDDGDICAQYCVELMKGLEAGGVIATAKHFAGRGDSSIDAHHEMPVLDASRERMDRLDLVPFKAVINAGLRALMTAHNSYPALDDNSGLPATLSPRLLIDFLRKQLGFKGVITTDAMGMAAIVKKWGVPQASAMALKSGCNLVLLKFDDELRSRTFFTIREWVKEGKLTEEELDNAVWYVLKMKMDQGLFENGGIVDPGQASSTFKNERFVSLSKNVARNALQVIRDRDSLLPLTTSSRLLVIEQLVRPEFMPNTTSFHYHTFNEAMLQHSMNIIPADTEFKATEEEIDTIIKLLPQVDIVVISNHYWRIHPKNNNELIRQIAARGTPVVVVTNNPYSMGSPKEAGTVICTYSSTPESMRAAADVVFGTRQAPGRWPLQHHKPIA